MFHNLHVSIPPKPICKICNTDEHMGWVGIAGWSCQKDHSMHDRYRIEYGMNPVSAMCYRIWDSKTQDWAKSSKYPYPEEYLTREQAEQEKRRLEGESNG